MIKQIASPSEYKRRFDRWANQRERSQKLQACRFQGLIYMVFTATMFLHYLLTKSKIWKVFEYIQIFITGFMSLQVIGHLTAGLWLKIKLPNLVVTQDQAEYMQLDNEVENVKILTEMDIIAEQKCKEEQRLAEQFEKFQIYTPKQLRNSLPAVRFPIAWKPGSRRRQKSYEAVLGDPEVITTFEEFNAWNKKKQAELQRERKVRHYRQLLQQEYMMIPRIKDSYYYTGVYRLATIDLPQKKPDPPIEADFQYPDHHSCYINVFKTWFSKKILHTLIFQFNCLDDALKSYCFNQSIGNISLNTLATLNSQDSNHRYLPYLRTVTRYLQASENQSFLVGRIRDLANGDSLAAFNDNKNWLEERFAKGIILPTDSAIIFHIFCVYMDMQLTGLDRPYEPMFSGKYVAIPKSTEPNDIIDSAKNRKVGILCTDKMRPKFHFILNEQVHTCRKEEEDVFLAIIQFLDYVHKYTGGLLDGHNLDSMGINILSIFDK